MFFFSCFLLLALLPDYLLFYGVGFDNRQARARSDRANACGDRNTGRGGGGGATATCYVIFCSLLYLFLLLVLFLFHCLQHNNRPGWTGPNDTDTGCDINTGRDGGGSMGTCHVTFCFLLYCFLLLTLFVSIVYSTTTGKAGRDVMLGPTRAAQQRGTGQGGRRGGRGGRRVGCRST